MSSARTWMLRPGLMAAVVAAVVLAALPAHADPVAELFGGPIGDLPRL